MKKKKRPINQLTPKQLDALAAFEYRDFTEGFFMMKGHKFTKIVLDGVDIMSRVKTLRKRRFIRRDVINHTFKITDAGRDELRKHGLI